MKMTPTLMRRLFRFFGPYAGAGIRVTHVGEDWRSMDVRMKLTWYNRNYFGSHFGGSLYSMVDPHYVLLVTNLLGREYIVWDKKASIDFVKPGTGTVYAKFRVSQEELDAIIHDASSGEPCYPEFDVNITNKNGDIVARVHKILYVRKKN